MYKRCNMPECVILITTAKTSTRIRCDYCKSKARLSNTPHQLFSTDNLSTVKELKLIKQCFLPVSHWFSTKRSQYQNWKANNYSIMAEIELGLPVLESSTRSQNFILSLTLNNISQTGLKRFNPRLTLLGTQSHNHYPFSTNNGENHLPETMQMSSKANPITHSSIDPQ